jgi:hypothetical protein
LLEILTLDEPLHGEYNFILLKFLSNEDLDEEYQLSKLGESKSNLSFVNCIDLIKEDLLTLKNKR